VLDSHFTIEILLCSAVVVCFRNGRRVANGIVGYGGTQITSPGEKIELSFRKPIEAIHLFVPLSVVASAYEEVEQSRLPSDYRMTDPAYASDLVMAKLGEVLYRESELQGQFGSLFLRSLAMAALARAMGFEPDSDPGRNRGGLAPWRLARAIKFIEDHVGDDLSLDEIAKHAGLSRMHFAAQFRKATGRSPHSFLMARRIELSKMLLTEGKMPLVQVAFTAGFSSQAHFTTVFRKVVGVTPGRWRQAPIIREQGRGATPLAADQEDDL
jgi:AraC-like DNA-binding protein